MVTNAYDSASSSVTLDGSFESLIALAANGGSYKEGFLATASGSAVEGVSPFYDRITSLYDELANLTVDSNTSSAELYRGLEIVATMSGLYGFLGDNAENMFRLQAHQDDWLGVMFFGQDIGRFSSAVENYVGQFTGSAALLTEDAATAAGLNSFYTNYLSQLKGYVQDADTSLQKLQDQIAVSNTYEVTFFGPRTRIAAPVDAIDDFQASLNSSAASLDASIAAFNQNKAEYDADSSLRLTVYEQVLESEIGKELIDTYENPIPVNKWNPKKWGQDIKSKLDGIAKDAGNIAHTVKSAAEQEADRIKRNIEEITETAKTYIDATDDWNGWSAIESVGETYVAPAISAAAGETISFVTDVIDGFSDPGNLIDLEAIEQLLVDQIDFAEIAHDVRSNLPVTEDIVNTGLDVFAEQLKLVFQAGDLVPMLLSLVDLIPDIDDAVFDQIWGNLKWVANRGGFDLGDDWSLGGLRGLSPEEYLPSAARGAAVLPDGTGNDYDLTPNPSDGLHFLIGARLNVAVPGEVGPFEGAVGGDVAFYLDPLGSDWTHGNFAFLQENQLFGSLGLSTSGTAFPGISLAGSLAGFVQEFGVFSTSLNKTFLNEVRVGVVPSLSATLKVPTGPLNAEFKASLSLRGEARWYPDTDALLTHDSTAQVVLDPAPDVFAISGLAESVLDIAPPIVLSGGVRAIYGARGDVAFSDGDITAELAKVKALQLGYGVEADYDINGDGLLNDVLLARNLSRNAVTDVNLSRDVRSVDVDDHLTVVQGAFYRDWLHSNLETGIDRVESIVIEGTVLDLVFDGTFARTTYIKDGVNYGELTFDRASNVLTFQASQEFVNSAAQTLTGVINIVAHHPERDEGLDRYTGINMEELAINLTISNGVASADVGGEQSGPGEGGPAQRVVYIGNEGDEVVQASEFDDFLQGGGGEDTFVFGRETGRDVIADFDGGGDPDSAGPQDVLDFRGSGLRFTDLDISVQAGYGTLVRYGEVHEIALEGFEGVLTSDNFIFDQRVVAEVGRIDLNHHTRSIELEHEFDNPVVFAFASTEYGSQDVTARITEVRRDGFDVFLQEPNAYDGVHAVEVLAYMVVEAGDHTLSNGMRLAARKFDTDSLSRAGDIDSFELVGFDDFSDRPAVIANVQSFNNESFVHTRVTDVTTGSARVALEREEAEHFSGEGHGVEEVGVLAFEAGVGRIDGGEAPFIFETGTTEETRTGDGYYTGSGNGFTVFNTFSDNFEELPIILAGLSSFNDTDPARARLAHPKHDGFLGFVEEDNTHDDEFWHEPETIDFLAFSGAGQLHGWDTILT